MRSTWGRSFFMRAQRLQLLQVRLESTFAQLYLTDAFRQCDGQAYKLAAE